ncbi:MAG: glycosyltransferase [Tyzzerella sp.]|nr:glycosyltransferase [Tyzzerella sp.]
MTENNKSFIGQVKGKKVLFITTKNIDYIRNTQEVRLLEENAQTVEVLYSSRKKYIGRILEIWLKLGVRNLEKIDVVFIGFAPQLILPFFKWKIRKKKIIIDFFISVYDTLIHDRKKFKDNGIIAKACHRIDSVTLKRANHVITDTKADARYFIEEFQSDELKFETLYLEADKSIYYPREQHKREDLKDKFVVLYFGSILPLQGVDVVLDAVKLLKDEKDIYFQIIGPIPEKYSKPIQDNVEYIDWLSQEELAEHIANADLCLAGHFSGDIDKAKRTIPGKAYIYEAMGKKMVLGDNEANRELYKKNSGTYYVRMGKAMELANIINERMIWYLT